MGVVEERPLARQLLWLQTLIVLVVVAIAVALAYVDARDDTRSEATSRAIAVAETVADSPAVAAAVVGSDPTDALQGWTSAVEDDAAVDFVVVMSPERVRFTHPDADQVGEVFVGDIGDALDGEVFVQEYVGTLGPSVRAVVPVFADPDRNAGTVVALVAVGVSLERISDAIRGDLIGITLAGVIVLAVGIGSTLLLARRVRRQTHGMGPREMRRMYEYYAAILHAVREGLLLLDREGRVVLANDEARRLLDLPDSIVGRHLSELGLPPALVHVATLRESAEDSADEVVVTAQKVLVVNAAPATWEDRSVGSVLTLRDRTDLQAVTGELDVVRALSDSLRAQNHESANRLHTVVSLVEMGRPEEAIDFATEELQVAQLLTDQVVSAAGDPVLAALLLGKSAEASERATELRIVGQIPEQIPVPRRDIVTVVGNLIDNALDATAGTEVRRIEVGFEAPDERALRIRVGDSGPGLSEQEAAHAFERGWSTKAAPPGVGGRGVGLALVAQVARRNGGEVVVGTSELGGALFTAVLRGRA